MDDGTDDGVDDAEWLAVEVARGNASVAAAVAAVVGVVVVVEGVVVVGEVRPDDSGECTGENTSRAGADAAAAEEAAAS